MSTINKIEKDQTALRMVVVSIIFSYVMFIAHKGMIADDVAAQLFRYGVFYSSVLMIQYGFTIFDVFDRPARLAIGIVIDVTMITVCLYCLNGHGAVLIPVYLWVAIGNGFRHGVRYLVACSTLSLAEFLYLCSTSPYWQGQEALVISGIVSLVIIPAYVGVLLARLKAEKSRAEQANQEKTRFLANVSHEIRTPLNAVVGFSEILDREADGTRRAQLTRNIKDASASLMSLVEGVLDFSRIESGHVQIEQEAFSLYGLVCSVEGMFSMQAGQGGVRYITDLDVGLPPRVCGDIDRLRQILVNLVGNAVKFTSAGEIKLRVSRYYDDESGEQILFEVIDTGIGISAAMQSRIFERFRQADDSVQRRYGGTGLGTSIAKGLVDLMEGHIGVDSEENKGSRFWFRIPMIVAPANRCATGLPAVMRPGCCVIGSRQSQVTLAAVLPEVQVFEHWDDLAGSSVVLSSCCVMTDCRAVAADDIGDIVRLGHQAGACLVAIHEDAHQHDEYLRAGFHLAVDTFEHIDNVLSYAASLLDTGTKSNRKAELARYLKNGKGLNILVTDDCRLNRHVMKAMLDDMGVQSDFASSGPMALEKLRNGSYDLMLLDIQMPGMSGFDVIELYKARNSEDKEIPIVVVTGDATAEIYKKCDLLGVSRFLLKPVDQEKLRHALTTLIATRGYESEPGIA
ncbi:MAG: response regulator [Gammaproteobacteria bacterium]|nr:response regulator [Gammaproteobacteria bacterium]